MGVTTLVVLRSCTRVCPPSRCKRRSGEESQEAFPSGSRIVRSSCIGKSQNPLAVHQSSTFEDAWQPRDVGNESLSFRSKAVCRSVTSKVTYASQLLYAITDCSGSLPRAKGSARTGRASVQHERLGVLTRSSASQWQRRKSAPGDGEDHCAMPWQRMGACHSCFGDSGFE